MSKANKNRGFTLVELIVVTAVVIIISAIVIFNQKEGKSNLAMDRSVQVITQAINQAINYSLGGKLHDGSVSSAGYGVYFTQSTDRIIIFADCDNDAVYDSNGNADSCSETSPGTPYPEFVEEKKLESGITISGFSACTGGALLVTVFRPPDPQTVFTPSLNVGCDEAAISISDTYGHLKIVYINKLGITRVE